MWRKGNPWALLVGVQIGIASMENSTEASQKIKLLGFSNSTSGHLSKENKNINLKRYMYPHVQCSIIYSSQDMETTQVPMDWWMNKDVGCVSVCNGILFNHKKE